MRQCQVCKDSEAKYKCPKCLIPFCSVSCGKKHSVASCRAAESGRNVPTATVEADRDEDEEDEGVISDEQLEKLAHSSAVGVYLKDKRIRSALRSIDGCKNRRKELEKLMTDEEFVAFADAVLDAVEFERE
eukprot:Plantae.Rhodophyta-Purpureofilum_apyrenoidigerum.ctg3089.p1 GENE.Plantae.Rhodophyta-Purpureofilum_apyrenoidigerum.ctg3089~~Plantae.Rhodophyta-Purpureofilum_apyrenoidigerum.ctg3089.p1  ORF type:complete len:131 (+),score=30.06 Plantae.Rhodophyta-Purpureofilum_apyrenoidigerum.ctg3089:142-534(+)